jgi:hypothetical protein
MPMTPVNRTTRHALAWQAVPTLIGLALLAVLAALVGAALSMLSPRVAAAQAFPKNCAGTYLVELSDGSQRLWTLTNDGVFLGTSSNQRVLNFSDAQGAWERDGNQGVKAVGLDFSFDPDSGALINVGRRDITLHTVGSGCDNVAGNFTLRLFGAGEDPLDPASDTGQPITGTFTGRRVSVSP